MITVKPSDLKDLFVRTLPIKPVMLWGPPGIGKTAIIGQEVLPLFAEMAKRRGVQPDGEPVLYQRRCQDYDLLDFAGLPHGEKYHRKDGAEVMVQNRMLPTLYPGARDQASQSGKKTWGILFLGEFPQANREKQTVIQRLLDEGRVGDYILPGSKADPDCELGLVLVVADGNRQSDKAQSYGMGTQTGTRFLHFTMEPEVQCWLDWAAKSGIEPTVQSWIQYLPEYLHKLVLDKRIDEHPTGPTPRTLEALSDLVRTSPPPSLELALYASAVGEEAARSFLTILHAARKVDINEVLRDPSNAFIPSECGDQFAVASQLIRRATPENLGAIIEYITRVGEGGFASEEVGVFVVEAAVRRNPECYRTKTYGDWAREYADIRS